MCTEFRTSHASIALVENYIKQWRKLWSFAKTKRIIKWFPGSSLALNFWTRSSMVERTVLRAPAAFRVATNFHNGHYEQQGSNPFCFCERRVTFWNFTFELEVSFQKFTLLFQKNTPLFSGNTCPFYKSVKCNRGITCPEFCTHLSVFLLGGDAFLARYYRFRSRSKQTAKDRARCAFIQPVKANQAVNQGNLELGWPKGTGTATQSLNLTGITNLRLGFIDHRWI